MRSWFDVRDKVIEGHVSVREFLGLASKCDDERAIWMIDLFKRNLNVVSRAQAREVFLREEKNRALSLCFAAVMLRPFDQDLLLESAHMGDSLAQALASRLRLGTDAERLEFAAKSAEQGDRMGWFELGLLSRTDFSKALACFLTGANLGCAQCMIAYGSSRVQEHEKVMWYGKAASAGSCGELVTFALAYIKEGLFDLTGIELVKALRKHVDRKKKVILESRPCFSEMISHFNVWESNFDLVCFRARAAADAWVILATRFNICKDIRRLISGLIWNSRFEHDRETKQLIWLDMD